MIFLKQNRCKPVQPLKYIKQKTIENTKFWGAKFNSVKPHNQPKWKYNNPKTKVV
jgi:hypothetical protein